MNGATTALLDLPPGRFAEYPDFPGHRPEETSRLAAERIAPHAPRLRTLVLHALNTDGPMTPDECAARLGLDVLSIRPRFSELSREGVIEKTGVRRPNKSGANANVWRAASRRTHP